MNYRLIRFKRSVLARCLGGCLMGAAVSVVSAQALADSLADPLADVQITADSIVFFPAEGYGGFNLRVSGPEGVDFEAQFDGESSPFFDLGTGEAAYPDGQYTYELTARPVVSAQAEVAMANARDDGQNVDWHELQASGVVSDPAPTQSGYFSIIDGAIVGSEDPFLGSDRDVGVFTRAQVIADDLIVDGSACVGFDCVNGESFGFDTLRLKENNLRIHFDDTSSSGSFPRNDWRIVINDTSNGGASYFAVEDSTAGTVPFRVVAGAGNNALYVDAQGDVGVGTSTPAVELQVTDGDSPTLRLEQNGSSGFTAQTWDVAGNETNFFVRDTTNGSKLPFRIRPGAPDNSIYVDTDGDVGMGTASPSNSLHVRRSDGTAKVLIEEASSTVSNRELL